jgi:hypothetical protein
MERIYSLYIKGFGTKAMMARCESFFYYALIRGRYNSVKQLKEIRL